MDTYNNVCKAGLLGCVIKGVQCGPLTHCIRIFESMCKPYRTAEITLINGDGQINELGLEVGDPVSFTIIDSHSQTYQMTSYVTSIPEMINADALRQDMVTIGTVTIEYMKDRANLVQSAYADIPMTAAAKLIHSQHIGTSLQMGPPSAGPISLGATHGGHQVKDQKPFTAIRKILDMAIGSGGSKTGSYVYFANKIASVMAPLEHIMGSAPIVADLIQRDIWGVTPDRDVWKAVLASKLYHKDNGSEAGGAGAQVAAASSVQTVYNIAKRFSVFDNKFQSLIPKLLHFGSGPNRGRRHSDHMHNSQKHPDSTAPYVKQPSEEAFQAKVKDGTNYLVKTTIENGFQPHFTVGNRVSTLLMAPLTSPYKYITPTLLIADCMYEAYFDSREVSGTVTIRGVVC